MHDAAKKAKLHLDVPWDEVRAARVQKSALEAFREAHRQDDEAEEAATKALPSKRPMSRRWVIVAALVAAAAAIVLWLRSTHVDEPAGATFAAVSTLSFADGSRSLLGESAEVHVVKDGDHQVRVRQDAGKVRYEVIHRPERNFEVGARGVKVTVLGTIFEVAVSDDKVTVSVSRGRVRVEHGTRKLELTVGETVTIEADPVAAPSDDHAKGAPAATDAPRDGAATAAPSAEHATEPDAAELMRRADAARSSGRLDEAAHALNELIQRHPGDQRVVLALFTLGKVERQRGNHGAAARAFERCGLALKGDALAEAASEWMAAGQAERAHAAARRYLEAFPDGVHAASMKALVQP